MKQRFPGIYLAAGKLATKNLAPGTTVYGEKTARENGEEYRLWDPWRSKLAAAIVKGLRDCPIKPGQNVLYLGAANGTTASHVSDIVGEKGSVYCVEFAPHSMRDLLRVCEQRSNMFPILADARMPEKYADAVPKVDVVYADVADRDQTPILLRNAKQFNAGLLAIAIKARCINSAKPPRQIFAEERQKIAAEASVLEFVLLDPFEADHCFITAKRG
ncbi:fibrillarin-like rRNA/tRNA 2'-O-methyltransferase [Candidatus Micrarchaeota archaeon]|nr:fibrillarin-like rRNA/tRNA 2'-O-methyltransferase [Candidatus Micrarchaeota archaeon]